MKIKLNELCLEITNACPMDCIHCSANGGVPLKDEMKFSEIARIIDDFAELGGEILEISGGEPLLHENVFEIIACAKEYDIETRLYTSGYLINEDIRNKLINSNLDRIIFNLQGSDAGIHEKITRTEGSFDKSKTNIKLLSSEDFWVGVHFVPMKPNVDDLKNTFEFCINELDVSEFAILRFVPQGRGLDNRKELELSPNETINLSSIMHEIIKENGSRARIGRPFNVSASCFNNITLKKCNAGLTKCLIKPNGEVAPCPAFKQNEKYVIGSIRKEKLSNIWEDEHWNEFRKFDYNELTVCYNCDKLYNCQGGCAAQRILAHNSINEGPDPSCIVCLSRLTELIEKSQINVAMKSIS